jgi:hypothetical protein
VHGEEYMLISPNSAIEIPRETKQGLLTTIIQRAGSIVLEVEKRNVKHFEVETPQLAALVKGTRFRVTVEKDGKTVRAVLERLGRFGIHPAGHAPSIIGRPCTGHKRARASLSRE